MRTTAYLQREGRTRGRTVEEMTVVRFITDKDGCGRRKRRGSWQYRIENRKISGRDDAVCLFTVYLPAYSYKKKPWKEKDKIAYIQGIEVPPEGRNVCYLYDEEARAFLGRREEPLSLEGLLFLMRWQQITFDALIVLQDRELETEAILAEYVRDTRYIGVVSAGEEAFFETKEVLLEEYGFLLDVAAEFAKLHVPAKGKTLVIAGAELYGTTPLQLPSGTTLVSTVVSGEAKRLCARAKEVRYFDVKSLLRDITA